MFRFALPPGAAITVSLPTGGASAFFHIGGGEFLSRVPPLMLAGLRSSDAVAGDAELVQGLPVSWDSATLPGDKPAQPLVFGFDATTAGAAVEAAAAAGDTFAVAMLGEIERAEQTLRAQQAVGMVPTEG